MKKNLFKTLTLVLMFISSAIFAQSRTEINLSGSGWKLWKDNDTTWKNEELFMPPVDIAKVPVHIPTGGWNSLNAKEVIDVKVPGTVEEYLQKVPSPEGDIKGVSWWFRTIQIPKSSGKNKILLRFESCRYRSEVFINQQLVGYDLIGNTPFEVDITNFVKAGEAANLALRITDPGGHFDWKDGENIKWGKYNVSGSIGYGGITGRVKLISTNLVYIDDIYIQNTNFPTSVNAEISILNSTSKSVKNDIFVSVYEKNNPIKEVFKTILKEQTLNSGTNKINLRIDAPNAKLWDLENPNLYVFSINIAEKTKILDNETKVFGFRSFEVLGIGKDALLKLNGKRIVLRTAISWGFWPVNGMIPTKEWGIRQVKLAKDLGLNMLSFHRCIGQPSVLEIADSLGLLYYEEPGNYMSGNKDLYSRAMLREKVLRMVKRDRSHPSLIMYNMQNEMRDVDSALFVSQKSDMRAAHQLDPSRTITRTSGWAIGKDVLDQAKLHARPFDTTLYMNGWFDYHRAPGPHTWYQALYENPTKYYNWTDNNAEIVYWGEEGALSSPPRIAKIKEEIDKNPLLGWDGAMYLDQFKDFDNFYKSKNLQSAFPSLDALTLAMGEISFEHQGRKIEQARLSNVADGYAVNGWESEILENHSGIVDCYRNPKGNIATMAYYNQAQYVAVKVRQQVIELPSNKVLVDFYAINEKDWKGEATLKIIVKSPDNTQFFTTTTSVNLKGGDVYGQLIAEGIEIAINPKLAGMYKIEAFLTNNGNTVSGKDEVLAVDWKSSILSNKGAVWEYGDIVKNFLKAEKATSVPNYNESLKKLDWILVSRSPKGGDKMIIPNEQLRDVSGKNKGLTATYFLGAKFEKQVAQQIDREVNLVVYQGATPHAQVPSTTNYSIRWEGTLIPPYTGTYEFEMEVGYGGEGNLIINGQKMVKDPKTRLLKGKMDLEAGKPVSILTELMHSRHTGTARVFWTIPDPSVIDGQNIINRVKNDGTTLILLDNSASWMDLISKNTTVKYNGKFEVGTNWLGGVHFAKQHPLFKDLPANQGLNSYYEAVVKNGNERLGIQLEGDELVAGAYHCFPQKLGTAVGVIPCGKGKIIFSTLDIYNNLLSNASTAGVAKKLLCNYLEFK